MSPDVSAGSKKRHVELCKNRTGGLLLTSCTFDLPSPHLQEKNNNGQYFICPSWITWQGGAVVCVTALLQLVCVLRGGCFAFLQDENTALHSLGGGYSRCHFCMLEKSPFTGCKIAQVAICHYWLVSTWHYAVTAWQPLVLGMQMILRWAPSSLNRTFTRGKSAHVCLCE